MARLLFIGEKLDGRTYELVGERTSVGRGELNKLVIHEDSVSHKHCEILVNGPEVIVIDLGSANGTFVNGTRLSNRQGQLKDGQIVKFGSVAARLELEEPAGESDATEITAVHDFARLVREQAKARATPTAKDARVTLEAGADPAVPTVMLPPPPKPEEIAAPPPHGTENRHSAMPTWVRIAAILVLVALAWLLWKR